MPISFASTVRSRLKDWALDQPTVLRLAGAMPQHATRVRRSTRTTSDLVIDGYPRSANTFALFAFQLAQEDAGLGPFEIANHWHRPSQFLLAARWDIPSLVLIREPRSAVLSNVIYHQADDPAYLIRRYIDFYKRVAAVQESALFAEFSEVVTDFGSVLKRLNERFETSFALFDHTAENVDRVQARIRNHSRRLHAQRGRDWQPVHTLSTPSGERARLKARYEARLVESKCRNLLAEASRLFEELRGAPSTSASTAI